LTAGAKLIYLGDATPDEQIEQWLAKEHLVLSRFSGE
jgi:hypothetical protein